MTRRRRAAAAAVLTILAAGCGEPSTAGTHPNTPVKTTATSPYAGSGANSPGWLVTTYYTAVESLHNGPLEPVTGCPQLDCKGEHSDLGSYPADFVRAVHDEGTGRITSGPSAGRYLNWSVDTGYWLDTAARDATGDPLRPRRSAAADGLAQGTAVRMLNCGHTDDGELPPAAVCAALSAPTWVISDAFTPGLGGERHIDLYLGEETGPNFTNDPLYTTLHGAVLHIG